jgi:hypothetical protein
MGGVSLTSSHRTTFGKGKRVARVHGDVSPESEAGQISEILGHPER